MLLALLYHHINEGNSAKEPDVFSSHLESLAERYPIVLPGDPLPSGKTSVCLTFDDAFFDFYHHVFPLLSELKIKALLAVPVRYIVEETDIDAASRLQVPHDKASEEGVYKEKVPFCTWAEISEMVKSGYVEVASHSFSHVDITGRNVDMNLEIEGSKKIIEKRLDRTVTTFVYPYGKFNREAQTIVQRHYAFSMRIGSALNKDWHNAHGLIYRVSADNLPDPIYPFRKMNLLSYYLKYLSNTVRGR